MDEITHNVYQVDNFQRAKQLHNSLNYFNHRESFQLCQTQTFKLMDLDLKYYNITNSRRCFKNSNDTGFYSDPCCNGKTAITQCCAPQNGTKELVSIKNALTNSDKCANYKKINALLADVVGETEIPKDE